MFPRTAPLLLLLLEHVHVALLLQAGVMPVGRWAARATSTVPPPPPPPRGIECQPVNASHPGSRLIPTFHAIPELRLTKPSSGGPALWWPGQANDANAVFEHAGVMHIMFQEECTALDALPGGICEGGKVGAHAFSHLVSTDGGAHWRRITDALKPTPGSTYDGQDGDCDGTVSFPEGIGPVIMWGADCGTGRWPPGEFLIVSVFPPPCFCLRTGLTDCLPACLPVCLSACLSVCLSRCLCMSVSVCLSICVCVSVSPNIPPPLPFPLPFRPSAPLPTHPRSGLYR